MLKICNSSYKYKNMDIMASITLTYLKAKIDEPENNIKIKNIGDVYRGINDLTLILLMWSIG
jgi:hypothetical protein